MAASAPPDGDERRRNHPAASFVFPHERVDFAHGSEREFARLLDFYGIAWEYEPVTFVLERDRAGRPVHAFTPDFYLPAFDRFVEVTTQRQRLVTKKNRKVRLLRALHPEVSISVVYQRHVAALAAKYGRPDQGRTAGAVGRSFA